MRRLLPGLVALAAALVYAFTAASVANAAVPTIYVGGAGCSDTGQGTQTQPYCTIIKAGTVAVAGQTVLVASGVYSGPVAVKNSGTAGSPIVFQNAPGASPSIQSGQYGFSLSGRSYVTVSGFAISGTVRNGIAVSSSDHITISNNVVTFAGQPASGKIAAGIALSGTSSSTVTGNTTDQNSDTGIYLSSGTTGTVVSYNEASLNANGYQRNANGINVVSPGNTIIGNVLHDNEDSGIQFYTGGNNNLATLNVSYNNGDHGIDDLNVTGGRLIGNTIYHNCTSGINVEGTSGNYLVENNIAVDNAVYPAYKGISCSRRAGNIGIWDSAPSSTTVDSNLVYLSKSGAMYVFGTSYASLAAMRAATGQEQHGLQANPVFVNSAGGDLRLASGSPAIDSADSGASGEQPADILGAARVDDVGTANTGLGSRAYDDRGAYEFGGTTPPTNNPPTARLSVSPTSGTAPLAVTADASTSTDPQGQSLMYKFDFGDGTVVGPQSGVTAPHTYTAAGNYIVTLTATDTGGLSSTATWTVTANPAANTPPTARLTVSPTTGTAPLAVTADASTSTDPQGQALTYKFDFGDGSAVVGPQAGATAPHTYASAGSYTVTVTATDTGGLSGTATAAVTVSSAPNTPPTARLTVSPTSGTAPLAVTADASTSTDPQGQVLTYTFDFGDGTAAVGPQSAATAAHTYAAAGSYTVTVTATDTGGLSSTATAAVTANPSGGGAAAITYVNQIATNYSTSSHSSGSITVWRTGGVTAGNLMVVTVSLTGTAGSGTVTGTDDAGDPLTVASDVSDATGHRLIILSGIARTGLAINQKISVTFPTAATYRITGDEVTGATVVDRHIEAAGSGTAYSSGPTGATSVAKEFVFSAVGLYAGSSPTWASGWKTIAPYAINTDFLGRAYQISTAVGSFTGSGTGSGSWLAATVTFA
jgi:parallel beta-helix repeat protein